MPGGSTVGNRVLSFFPRGPLATTREVSRYSNDLTPVTNAFSFGVEQKLFADLSVSATYVHRRSHDLLTRRIVNLFPAAPGSPNFGQTTDGGPRINEVTYEGHIDYDGVAVALASATRTATRSCVSYTYSQQQGQPADGRRGLDLQQQQRPGGGLRSLEPVRAARLHRQRPRRPALGLQGSPPSTPGAAASPSARAACRTSTATASWTSATPPRRATASAPRPTARSTRGSRRSFKIGGRHALSALDRGVQPLQPRQREEHLERGGRGVRHAHRVLPGPRDPARRALDVRPMRALRVSGPRARRLWPRVRVRGRLPLDGGGGGAARAEPPDIKETRWESGRPPGGTYDHIRVHRYRTAGPAKAALLYLPGTNMNGQVALADEDHNLWIFLARRGRRGLRPRLPHRVPSEQRRQRSRLHGGLDGRRVHGGHPRRRRPRAQGERARRSSSWPASAAGRSSPTPTRASSRTAWPAS